MILRLGKAQVKWTSYEDWITDERFYKLVLRWGKKWTGWLFILPPKRRKKSD